MHCNICPMATTTSSSQQYGDLFEGSIVRTDFVQWQIAKPAQPAGLKNYLEWMGKDGGTLNQNSISGWLNADLFVAGLKAAGPDFTRQKVVDGINKMTDYNGNGILYNVDWTAEHTHHADPNLACDFVSTIKNSKFVPNFTKPGKPWHCVTADPSNGTVSVDNRA